MSKMVGEVAERDSQAMQERLRLHLCRQVFGGTQEENLCNEQSLDAAYAVAPLSFWTASEVFMKWTAGEITAAVQALEEQTALAMPIAIACGAYANAEEVHRSCLRLRDMLPSAII